MCHPGFAFLNVICPCVTFNNNAGSTKSYDYVREHQEATATFDFVPLEREIKTQYQEGTTQNLTMHDGSVIHLHKLAKNWNPLDRISAMDAVMQAKSKNEILTGLLYMNPDTEDLHDTSRHERNAFEQIDRKRFMSGFGNFKRHQRQF